MSNRHRAPAVQAVPGANPPFQHQPRANIYHQTYTPQVSSASATNGPVMYNHHGAGPPGHNPHAHPAAHHAHQYSTTTPPPAVQGGAPVTAAGPGQRPPYYALPPSGAGGRMPHQGGPRMPLGPRMNQPPPSAGGNPPPHHQQPPTYAQIPSVHHQQLAYQQVPQLILHHPAHGYSRFPGAPPVSGQGYYPPQAHPGMHPQPGMPPMAGAPMYQLPGGQFAGYPQAQFPMQMAPQQVQVQVPATQQPPPPSVTTAQTAAPPPPHSQSNQQQAAPAAAQQQPPATVAAGQPRPGPGQTPPAFHQPPQPAYVAPNMYNAGPHQGHPYQQQQQQQQQPPVTTGSAALPAKAPPKRRSQAIKIINPDSGRNVLDELNKGSEEAKKEEANATKKDESGPAAGAAVPTIPEKEQPAAAAVKPEAVVAAEPAAAVAAADPAAAVKNSIRDEFTRKVAAAAAESKTAAPKATQPEQAASAAAGVAAASKPAAAPKAAPAPAPTTKPIHSENTLAAAPPPSSSSSLSNSNSTPAPHRLQSSTDQVNLSAATASVPTPPDTPSPPKSNDVIKGAEPVSPTPLPPPTPSNESKKEQSSSAPKPDESIQPAAAPKQGSKKSASAKKAELNSKGALGSDMDAFTGLPEEKDAAPAATAPAPEAKTEEKKPEVNNHVNDKTVDLSSSTSSLTSTDTLPVKEDVVAAVMNHKEDTPPVVPAVTPVAKQILEEGEIVDDEDAPLENGTSSQSGSQIKLKYTYKEGQWSPCNPEGKKQYDRDFLHALSKDPKSLVKPMNLPQMDIIKDKANPAKINSASTTTNNFMPSFIKPTISRGPGGGGGGLTKRGSRDGRDAKRSMGGPGAPQPRIINLAIPSTQVELHKTENAWKPGQMAPAGKEAGGEEDPLAEVSKQTLAILNKLTPQKFDKLLSKFNEIKIDTESKLRKCMELIFEKAVDEPGFAVEYAKMCKNLNQKQVKDPRTNEAVNFRKLLITRCQTEFQKDYMEGIDPEKLKEQIANAETEDEKKKLQEEFNDKEKKARRRSSGNTRFIGELYKLEMLTVRIMHECIRGLLNKQDEESLECLCTLVSSIGKVLEENTAARNTAMKAQNGPRQAEVVNLDFYFNQMQSIVDQKKTSSRIRCLLLDLIELRVNKWVPRRKVAGPKTIDQIHKEIEKDRNQQQLADLAYQAGGPSKSLGGNYGRGGGGGGPQNDGRKKSSQRMDNDGWSITPGKSSLASKPQEKFDPRMNPFASGTQNPFNRDPFNRQKESGGMGPAGGLVLGRGGSNFSSWGKGSGSKMSNAGAGAPSGNRFDALSMQSSERSASPGPGGRMASRSVQGNMGGGGGGGGRDYGRNDALQAVKNFGKQSVPNGPMGGVQAAGYASPAPAPASAASAVMRLEIGQPDEVIANRQSEQLKGSSGKFANLDDEDTKEAYERRIVGILKEYIHQPNVQEVLIVVKESCRKDYMTWCVEQWIQHVLEAKVGSREKLGYFLVLLVKEELLQRVQVFQGLSNVLEFAEEMICDIPKYWDYFGELIAPMLESRHFAMNILPETVGKINEGVPCELTGKYVEAVLRLAVQKTSKVKVAEMWNEACLSWKTFLPEDKMNDFLEDRKIKENLEFTLSSSPPSSASAPSNNNSSSAAVPQDPSKMSHDQIRSQLDKLLDNSIPPQKEALTNFVDNYVKTCKDGQPDNAFIRIVTTAVVKSCLPITKQENSDPSQQNIKCDFQDGMFEEKAWFLRRLLDGKPNRQIQSIYAMVTLMIELEHPSRLLVQIFEALHGNDLVSTETFFAWEKCDDPAHQESKGVAIKSTIPFFSYLKEDYSSGSDSEDDD